MSEIAERWPESDEAAEEVMRQLYDHWGGIAWRDERVRRPWIPERERLRETLGALVTLGIIAPAVEHHSGCTGHHACVVNAEYPVFAFRDEEADA